MRTKTITALFFAALLLAPLPALHAAEAPLEGTFRFTPGKQTLAAVAGRGKEAAGEPLPKPAGTTALSEGKTKQEEERRAARLQWFHEAKYGLFINWGLYSIPAGEWKGKPIGGIGEWIMHNARIPVKEYELLAKQFNPVKFNADEWAQLAVDAGMKYVVFDCKHHDGFALYHSAGEQVQLLRRHAVETRPVQGTAEPPAPNAA